ncbi:hypothetical protein IWQ61_006318 [Dispira simplex]|nr:hypothetical protein IWQ61_006318 [Dispira simplex]
MEPGEQSPEPGPTGTIITDTDNPTLAQPTMMALTPTHGDSTAAVDPATRDTIDRMADIRTCLGHQKIPAQAISTILQGLRPTMLRQYKWAWQTFGSWCGKEPINRLQPSVGTLLRFLKFLGDEKQASIATIKAHRAAIISTWDLCYPNQPSLTDNVQVRYYTRAKPQANKRTSKPPVWDIKVLLDYFSKETKPDEELNITDLA